MVEIEDLEAAPRAATRQRRRERSDSRTARAVDTGDFAAYQIGIMHDWLLTMTLLASTLVPLFFVLDIFMTPHGFLERFAVYRLLSTALAVSQYFIVLKSKPSRWSFLHGYFVSLQIGGTIALMTVALGGFDSSYYAGLNLVIIGVNLLMPWRAVHTAVNALIILVMYVGFNLIAGHTYLTAILINNLFFLCSTAVVSVAINHVRYRLIENEFKLLVELKRARDALWSEMELAKRIQTALSPQGREIPGYEVAATMLPAKEVGGDYYDIIETDAGEHWIAIGDVAGHGVDSGLIMMMAQTSIMTVIKGRPECTPLDVLGTANTVLKENIARLGSNHYMTILLVRLERDHITITGHHQDVLFYEAREKTVRAVTTKGTWLGITDQIRSVTEVTEEALAENDMFLLFTDGVTECTNRAGEMYGQERLQAALVRYGELPVQQALDRIMGEVRAFQADQLDDITLILVRRRS